MNERQEIFPELVRALEQVRFFKSELRRELATANHLQIAEMLHIWGGILDDETILLIATHIFFVLRNPTHEIDKNLVGRLGFLDGAQRYMQGFPWKEYPKKMSKLENEVRLLISWEARNVK